MTVGGTAATAMRGGLRGHLFIRPAMFVGLLSLAGVPPLVGLRLQGARARRPPRRARRGGQVARAWSCSWPGLLTVVLTAAYCMRALVVLDDLASADVERHDADAATVAVRAAVTVLALLTVARVGWWSSPRWSTSTVTSAGWSRC